MNDVAHFPDLDFEDTVCRGIGNHVGSEIVTMCFYFFPQIFHIDGPFHIRRHSHRVKTGLHCAGRIGSVCRSRDKHYLAMSLANALQVTGYNQ